MEKHYYSFLDETVYHEELSNGLNVFLIPKKDYQSTCGIIATKFGSLQSNAVIKYNGLDIHVTRGSAHFLEHRMFDNKKGSVDALFSALGAYSNAFTSFDKTAYYFQTTQKVNDCINLLLDFVNELNISKESVEKEKDIIVEEIKMCNDNPSRVAFREILSCLYKNNEIRYDVGGSEEDVRSTTYDILKATHETFYHPRNMVLVVCGNFIPCDLIEVIRNNQNAKGNTKQNSYYFDEKEEPNEVYKEYEKIEMDVALTKIAVGYKHLPYSPSMSAKEKNKMDIIVSLYLDLVFGVSSKFNEKLYNSHVILYPVSTGILTGDTYRCSFIFADTNDEKTFIESIDKTICNPNFTLEEFNRVKNAYIGMSIKKMDDVSELATLYMSNYFQGVNYFDDFSELNAISYEDVMRVASLFKDARKSVFVITPKKVD